MQAHLTTWEDRFWAKVVEDEATGCWVWTAWINQAGYGQFGRSKAGCRAGRTTYAHRIAYELVVGVIPVGLTLDHLCRNPPCVNPAHLEAVSMRTNVLRGVGPSAQNARKTHCKHGHPFSGDNLWTRPDGARGCRACHRKNVRDALRRMRARRAAA